MKRLFIILFLFVFVLNSVYACQYKTNETYQEIELGLYDTSGDYVGKPLIFSNFSGGYQNIAGCSPISITISNPLSYDITADINFTARHDGSIGWPQEDYFFSKIMNINAFSSEQIVGGCPAVGGSRLLEDSIKYVITSPELLIPKLQEVDKQREICKLCENEVFLDDGISCNSLYDDSKCGSGICNIAGFCGTIGTLKVVDCPNGKLNCQNKICLEPSILQAVP